MKKIMFLFCFLFLLANLAIGQVYKLRALKVSIKEGNTWSAWKDCDILTVFDTDKHKITIYSSKKQVYDLVSTNAETGTDDSGREYAVAKYVDQDGDECLIKSYFSDAPDKYDVEMYILFNNIKWGYLMDIE